MDINEAVQAPSFGRHETFHPRYGWLKKAYDQIYKQGDAFRADDATVRFGVGKNMVRSIRFWSLAFKITTEEPKNNLKTTNCGNAIFGDGDGLDPYLERPETLWILHWLLLAPPCRVPTWWLIMNQISGTVVGTGDLLDIVQEQVKNNPKWNAPSPASVKRDVDVFLHTYTSKRDRLTIEEYIDCPFRNMRLASHDGRSIRFMFGPKTGLTPTVVAFACADFAARTGSQGEISVARLAVEPGSVGNAFKMNEGDIADSLKIACSNTRYMTVSRINGEPHLVFKDNINEAAHEMLAASYGKSYPRADSILAETVS